MKFFTNLSSIACFQHSSAPIISLFLSTYVAPNNSNASIRSFLLTRFGILIKYSTMCLWPVKSRRIYNN